MSQGVRVAPFSLDDRIGATLLAGALTTIQSFLLQSFALKPGLQLLLPQLGVHLGVQIAVSVFVRSEGLLLVLRLSRIVVVASEFSDFLIACRRLLLEATIFLHETLAAVQDFAHSLLLLVELAPEKGPVRGVRRRVGLIVSECLQLFCVLVRKSEPLVEVNRPGVPLEPSLLFGA